MRGTSRVRSPEARRYRTHSAAAERFEAAAGPHRSVHHPCRDEDQTGEPVADASAGFTSQPDRTGFTCCLGRGACPSGRSQLSTLDDQGARSAGRAAGWRPIQSVPGLPQDRDPGWQRRPKRADATGSGLVEACSASAPQRRTAASPHRCTAALLQCCGATLRQPCGTGLIQTLGVSCGRSAGMSTRSLQRWGAELHSWFLCGTRLAQPPA